jgi:hypothetical protein
MPKHYEYIIPRAGCVKRQDSIIIIVVLPRETVRDARGAAAADAEGV